MFIFIYDSATQAVVTYGWVVFLQCLLAQNNMMSRTVYDTNLRSIYE